MLRIRHPSYRVRGGAGSKICPTRKNKSVGVVMFRLPAPINFLSYLETHNANPRIFEISTIKTKRGALMSYPTLHV